MDRTTIDSPAFRRAALASERLRVICLLAVIIVMIVVGVVRGLLQGDPDQLRAMPRIVAVVGVFLVYEFGVLRAVTRRLRTDREPPSWAWFVNTFIETLIPTVVIGMLTFTEYVGPYRALVMPVCLAYFFFIILATLRLSPSLCLLTGVFAAAEYFALVLYTFHRFPSPPADSGAFAFAIYATFSVVFVIGGAAAAAVAHQIRRHVVAALHEADLRREKERLERDLDIARSIQQGLLPQNAPSLAGFQIAGWSRPADQTGGDYYDWQELPGGRLVVSLADVTGHGIGPALVTAVCRAYSRASFLGGEEFGSLVDRLHRLLAEDLPSDRFITFVAALFESDSDRAHILSAGHGPIFVYSAAEDRVHAHNADDVPFGVLRDKTYGPARTLELKSGDMLILITDGFFEWPNEAGEQFGIERLSECIRAGRDLAPADLIVRLHEAVERFVGTAPQQDDLTAVVVKRV